MHRCIALIVLLTLPLGTTWGSRAQTPVTGGKVSCENGQAGPYPCRNVDLLSFLPISAIGGADTTEVADIWGWTDPETGREYALVARNDATSFVDVSNPQNPVFLGELPSHTSTNPLPSQRDVKVFGNYALVVSEVHGHGMQVFDLTQLRNVQDPPVKFEETVHYDQFSAAHNLAVNEETGFAYVLGAHGGISCSGGLHMIDMENPTQPEFAGCFADPNTGRAFSDATGYTHDAQCVVYRGPDPDYQGREICFSSNETALSIADVTDKQNPVSISTGTYPNSVYTHQGWLTESQRYFLLGDELDERRDPDIDRTRTIIFDLQDLDDPEVLTAFTNTTPSIDHNIYVQDDRAYEANYTSGLRVLDISNISSPREVAFFDTFPAHNRAKFAGAWSNYPFFESGIVIVSSIGEGLFVLDPNESPNEPPGSFALRPPAPNPFYRRTTLKLALPAEQPVTIAVYDLLGRRVAVLQDGPLPAGTHPFTLQAGRLSSGTYVVHAAGQEAFDTQLVTLIE